MQMAMIVGFTMIIEFIIPIYYHDVLTERMKTILVLLLTFTIFCSLPSRKNTQTACKWSHARMSGG